MARRKQPDSSSGSRAGANRSYSLADALSATHEHTVPVLPAEDTTPARKTPSRGTSGPSPTRTTLAPRTAAHPTLADTTASTTQGKIPRRVTQQPAYSPGALADAPTRRQPALYTAPEMLARPAYPMYGEQGDISDEIRDDDADDSRALVPGRPTIALPTLTDAQLPALRGEIEDRELAVYDEPAAPAVFIHGARKAPRPYVHVVPRRIGRRPFLVQFIVAMMTVMALFTVVTLASPLSQNVAFANMFQSYANAVPWVPTPTPKPRPTATPVPYSPPRGSNPGQQAVINEIVAVFGGYSQGALAVARCESGYDPNAWNSYPIGNSHAEGVFQILYPSTWDTTSFAADSPYNYVDNILAAHQIFSRDGNSWREWACQP
ncbi:MAG TPA: hypothetical protein VKQ30_15075 [Ktedonobacterales bacterium]|nr:hypothetical protein [Ktedonobacterales bacterium]